MKYNSAIDTAENVCRNLRSLKDKSPEYTEGFKTGFADELLKIFSSAHKGAQCPYKPGTPERDAWFEGRHKGEICGMSYHFYPDTFWIDEETPSPEQIEAEAIAEKRMYKKFPAIEAEQITNELMGLFLYNSISESSIEYKNGYRVGLYNTLTNGEKIESLLKVKTAEYDAWTTGYNSGCFEAEMYQNDYFQNYLDKVIKENLEQGLPVPDLTKVQVQ